MASAPIWDEEPVKHFLTCHGWPEGFQLEMIKGIKNTALRFVIVDNSGSMVAEDGQMVCQIENEFRFKKCSRFEELRSNLLDFHLGLAGYLPVTTYIQFLNTFPTFVLGGPDGQTQLTRIHAALQELPTGCTPLYEHILAFWNIIEPQISAMKNAGLRAVLVIITDGVDSSRTFEEVATLLTTFVGKPVWVVVRLCTNDKAVMKFWNKMDGVMENQMEVMDDLNHEAKEISRFNPWLSYAPYLHQFRESGMSSSPELDRVDEVRLTKAERVLFIAKLLNVAPQTLNINNKDGFWAMVESYLPNIPLVWNPKRQQMVSAIIVPKKRWCF